MGWGLCRECGRQESSKFQLPYHPYIGNMERGRRLAKPRRVIHAVPIRRDLRVHRNREGRTGSRSNTSRISPCKPASVGGGFSIASRSWRLRATRSLRAEGVQSIGRWSANSKFEADVPIPEGEHQVPGPARAGALIYAKDLERLSGFYQQLLGMKLLKADVEHHVIESAEIGRAHV